MNPTTGTGGLRPCFVLDPVLGTGDTAGAPWDYLRAPRLYDYGNNREPWPRQVGGWLLKGK